MSDFFHEVAKTALTNMTDYIRFTAQDQEIVANSKDELRQLLDGLVKEFYDSLFANPVTASIFQPGERPAREKSLAQWWERTIEGPVNDDYWAWQAYVGLLHVKRRVTNAIMLSQTIFIISFLRRNLAGKSELLGALERLLATVAVVIAYSYDLFLGKSIEKVTGVSGSLLAQQVALGVDEVLGEFKR